MLSESLNALKRIAIVVLFFTSNVSYAADATGYIRAESCSLLTYNHIHLEYYRGAPLTPPLVLEVGNVDAMLAAFADLVDVPGSRCPDGVQCESAVKSKVQITHVSHKWPHRGEIAGLFVMEFRDGTISKGSFRVKSRGADKSLICE